MRSVPRLLLAIVALSVVALATPTTPFVSKAYELPFTYAVRTASGSLDLRATVPTDPAEHLVAFAQFNSSNADIGWDYLDVSTVVATGTHAEDYFAAGYLEGYLTSESIVLAGIITLPTGPVGDWIVEHIAYLRAQSKKYRGTDKFWATVGNMLSLMEGISAGASKTAGFNVTFEEIFMINFQSETGDVPIHTSLMQDPSFKLKKAVPNHCSALIKVTHDDLFMAHDMWGDYSLVPYRVFKVYRFAGNVVSFSAHPAYISSQDDWYQTAAQLAIMETTNSVFNTSLYTAVVPQTVSEFLRVIVATILADGGESWTALFSRENSGTYNNQYMVIDYKRFVPGSSVVANTLWLAEQIPGYVHRADVSDVLAATGYWASYNIPYFQDIFEISGYSAMEAEYGSFFSYSKYARPEIFRRNQSHIKDLAGMQRMLRYNQYQTDPLSVIPNCTGAPHDTCMTPRTAMLSIASRGDLMTVYNTTAESVDHYGPLFGYMACGCFGAIDSKIAAWSSRHSLRAFVIAGPSNDEQPTFAWNTGGCTGVMTPAMTPTIVDFPWVQFDLFKPAE